LQNVKAKKGIREIRRCSEKKMGRWGDFLNFGLRIAELPRNP